MSTEQYSDLGSHIQFVIHAHQYQAKIPDNAVRGWDNETPYSIHPLWCATTILTETSLPKELRLEGAVVLLYHDIIEDTNAMIPNNLLPNIFQGVVDMTFTGGMRQEMIEIWGKEQKIRLYKLYDKVSNLLDAMWMSPEYRQKYTEYTRKLLADVEEHFGSLNIVKIAHPILADNYKINE